MKSFYRIIRAVSPSMFGGETKNQDRILFDSETNTACVCDGTTSSPYAELAAKFVSRSAPILLDNHEQNLKTMADYLMAYRDRAIKKGVKADNSIPVSIRSIVQDAVKVSLKQSFQTTLAAASFERQASCTVVRVLSCGDSGFWALSPIGELLFTTLQNVAENPIPSDYQEQSLIPYYPNSELLIKITGTLSEFPDLLKSHKRQSPDKWYVCKAVCHCGSEHAGGAINDSYGSSLKPGELLLVPKYLVAAPKDPEYQEFRRLYYSRFVHRTVSPGLIRSDMHFNLQGNTTAVLPDHFYTGQWVYLEERFPVDTHFLICSDGFYRAFSDLAQMWIWLKTNEDALMKKVCKRKLLQELHDQLSRICGDDDISFIWMIPSKGEDTYAVGSNE